jgi:PAS domain-containing protein
MRGELRNFSLRLPPEGDTRRPAALAAVLVRGLSTFVEAEGHHFITRCEVDAVGRSLLPSVAEGAAWLEMLMQATENLPFALIVADMHEPGAKLVCVNAVFERLTGWAKGDALGQNCRFLQGEGTEQEALAQLIAGQALGLCPCRWS